MKFDRSGVVLKNIRIGEGLFLMSIRVGDEYRKSNPGQFVMIRPARSSFPLLNRPLSINSIHVRRGVVSCDLLYRVVGEGTDILSRLKRRDEVAVNGPLGKGFDFFPRCPGAVVIAGGIGIAPLNFLMKELKAKRSKTALYLGSATASNIPQFEDIQALCGEMISCTEDGTCGETGLVTEIFARDMDRFDQDRTVIYSCGPAPMLKRLKEILSGTKFKCQVSVEERMACGIGACLGCVVRVKGSNRRVCKDGPVFELRDIEWG